MKAIIETVDDYITSFPEEMQPLLQKVRKTIREKAPKSLEGISYGMPSYKLNGKTLVYFAGYKNHIGFYATPSGHTAFAEELSVYKHGKGSVQFPLDKPLPYRLIGQITEFRVIEVLSKTK